MKIAVLSGILIAIMLSGCGGGSSGQLLQSSTPTPNESQNAQLKPKEFTLDQLKQYDGLNGNPAYVAVNGVVYDVTKSDLWKNGMHQDCSVAGQDLTEAIGRSPHGMDALKRMPTVGILKK